MVANIHSLCKISKIIISYEERLEKIEQKLIGISNVVDCLQNKMIESQESEGIIMPEILFWQCKKCGHQWFPRTMRLPKVCSKCKSRYWYVEKGKKYHYYCGDHAPLSALSVGGEYEGQIPNGTCKCGRPATMFELI